MQKILKKTYTSVQNSLRKTVKSLQCFCISNIILSLFYCANNKKKAI